MKKFEVGQSVYCSSKYTKDLVVVSCNKFNVICSGKMYHENEKGYSDGWHEDKCIRFYIWELKDKPFEESTQNIHVKNKWDKIIKRNPNMVASLSYMYEDYLSGDLNLNPSYQRDLVWTLEQKQKYIEAIFAEKAFISPTIVLNWSIYEDGCGRYEVLDGKQRLTTAFDFINDKFPLSNGMYFSDLSRHDHSFFIRQDVKYTRIEKWCMEDLTLEEKIELFLEINELGTKMSDEHIKKVKEMIK
ncbi:MAG: DUF262 domain-containing protein [Clostridium chrysemydis]|uniref:DUF262 domain-containing protein n=1 Tax=Clostridium chrysemydis TaxID=2665504 RepID=UPI003F385002